LTGNIVIPVLPNQNPRVPDLSNLARPHPHALGRGIEEVLVRLTDGGGEAGDGEYVLGSDRFRSGSTVSMNSTSASRWEAVTGDTLDETRQKIEAHTASSERNHRITR
jgi:hypothetical protein